MRVNRTSPPLHRPRPRRPLPRRHCCRRFSREVPTSRSRSDHTDSHGLAGFLRRLPRLHGALHHCWRRIRGLVASRCRSWGSLRFSSSFGWFRHPTLAIAGRCAAGHANAASPQRVSYPSKDSPHPQPFRVATTVASLVFASRAALIASSHPLPASTRVSRLRDAAPSRRCSADESVPALAVSSVLPAYPYWALAPFEVLRPRDCSRGGCIAHAVRHHPSEPKSLFGRRRSCRSLWLEARGERASLRSAPASSSLTVQPLGWGSPRRPWWRGVRRNICREASVVTAMKQVSR